jgi:hypothetical protein
MDDPRRERGAERADSETARSEYLDVCRRCKGRVHPGAGYPVGLPRDSGRGMPWATADLPRAIGTGGSCVGNAVEPVMSGERALEGEIKGLRTPTA